MEDIIQIEPPQQMEDMDIIEHGNHQSEDHSENKEKDIKASIRGVEKNTYVHWANVILLLIFASLCMAIGSVDEAAAKNGLEIG